MDADLNARPRVARPAAVDRLEPAPLRAVLRAEELRAALETLGHGPVHLTFRHGALDLTSYEPAAAVWETVFVEGGVEGLSETVRRRTLVDGGSLQAALGPDDDVTLRLAGNGALVVADVVLTPSAGIVPDPPRPDATGVLKQRLVLPTSAGVKLILRLDGPNVCVPSAVRQRFSDRQISSVSLFERAGEWFISGVRNGTPNVIVVGAVGVY